MMGEKVEDTGEGMQCNDHPYRNNPVGGICAFCLQEKLSRLVSSSKLNPFFQIPPPSTPSPSPSSPKKIISSSGATLLLKRSRSVAAADPHKKTFWSFLRLSRRRSPRLPASAASSHHPAAAISSVAAAGDDSESPNSSQASSSFGRKVARSRSVGCGSRSFSGDFLERISTGLGDCALRRVESQREAKPKIVLHRVAAADDRIKEKVKCGGIFGGFGMIGGSSSSSAAIWLPEDFGGRIPSSAPPHGRSKSWGWAFASPMRAFRPGSKLSAQSAVREISAAGPGAGYGHGDNRSSKMDTSPSLLAVTS